MPDLLNAWCRRLSDRCRSGVAVGLLAVLSACAAPIERLPVWETRLRGDTLALLGEVHDNPAGHALRQQALQRALTRGWRPAVAMEQFDIDRQADIERARRERPRDADHLISAAGGAGWDWMHYRPLVQLALDHDLPLLAANLPRTTTARLVREPADAVFGGARAAALGLAAAPDPQWQQAQQQAIDAGHCGALPATLLPGMVRAQAARDAVMAERLARQAPAAGVVLIAGNGHVRRDLGVPQWLEQAQQVDPARVLSVGYLENAAEDDGAFDATVGIAPRTDRPDPCAALRAR